MKMYVTFALLAISLATGQSKVTQQKLAIPSYFYPGNLWTKMQQSKGVGIEVINPNSGPGASKDKSYADTVQSNVKAGHKVLCYVDTGYFGVTGTHKTRKGESSVSAWTTQIKQDIDKAYEFYGSSGLSGIFLDDALNDCGPQNSHVNLYKDINKYIKGKHTGAFVVLNPGSGVEQCYASAGDVLLVFEHDYQSYLNWKQPSWSQNQANGQQFWHLIYATKNQADMEHAIKLSKQRNAGYVYVTNDDLPNPWDTLPPYWDDELRVANQA